MEKTVNRKKLQQLAVSHLLFISLACDPSSGDSRGRASEMPLSTESTPKTAAEEAAEREKERAKSNNQEAVDIPSHISGALLTCAVRREAREKSLEAEIGCRLADQATGKKIAADVKLSFTSNDPNRVVADVQADAALYHVLYRISGRTLDEIRQAAQSVEAIVLYDMKTIKQEKIYNVLKPAIVLDDYEAEVVRQQAIDPDAPGSL